MQVASLTSSFHLPKIPHKTLTSDHNLMKCNVKTMLIALSILCCHIFPSPCSLLNAPQRYITHLYFISTGKKFMLTVSGLKKACCRQKKHPYSQFSSQLQHPFSYNRLKNKLKADIFNFSDRRWSKVICLIILKTHIHKPSNSPSPHSHHNPQQYLSFWRHIHLNLAIHRHLTHHYPINTCHSEDTYT